MHAFLLFLAACDGSKPGETADPDTGETDTTETDTTESDTTESGPEETDTSETDTSETDTSETDTGETDTGDTGTADLAPTVTFLAPSEGVELDADEPVALVAQVSDDTQSADELTLLWTIDGAATTDGTATIDGALVTLAVLLDPGEHEVTLSAFDAGGNAGSDQVTFRLVGNEVPSAWFDAPVDGERFLAGAPIEVDLGVADADTVDLTTVGLAWSGTAATGAEPSAPGSDGHARFVLSPDEGRWSLLVEVTDADGATVTAVTTFDVVTGDSDGDGHVDASLGGDDCDDTDADVWPGAPETCDGLDQDCDGVADDDAGDALDWFADGDGDGFGDPASVTRACDAPAGHVGDDADCDDGDPTVHPDAAERCDGADNNCDGAVDGADSVDLSAWYPDGDADGWGDGAAVYACDAPVGYAATASDCDDADDRYHPGADESDCTDANDYNCDGRVSYADGDGDGWAACEECDDTRAAVNPGADEVCDGLDNDCDGTADGPTSTDATSGYVDADGDGHGDPALATASCGTELVAVGDDCDDGEAGVHPGASEACDGEDDDCDGVMDEGVSGTWYPDVDGDGHGDGDSPVTACAAPADHLADATDCDDTAADVYPGATETCDGEDDDCDGVADDGAEGVSTWYADADGDGYGDPADLAYACEAPPDHVANAADCDDTRATVSPADAEACDAANLDEDCDGNADDADTSASGTSTWYADGDHDGYGGATSVSRCDAPSGYVVTTGDCNDADAGTSPSATETCDGADDDCDGSVDEGATTTWYRDVDGDGYGRSTSSTTACTAPAGYVANASDCNDNRADVSPGDLEYCDGSDNDCDGATDENGAVDATTWHADTDGDSYGDPAVTLASCSRPSGYVGNDTDCDDGAATVNPATLETCDEQDNDCDGTVDEGVATTWFRDADGDSYGTTSRTVTSCTSPAGYVANATDCDDGDSTVSPAATEVCDAADEDEDCDGLAEDADPTVASSGKSTWYLDADGDGHGGATTTVAACDAPADAYALPDDCDDGDAATSPSAGERCNDGIDQDCDGADATCTYGWSGDYNVDDVAVYDAKVYGDTNGDYVGGYDATASRADFDGDGIANLAVGAYGDDVTYSASGSLLIQTSPITEAAFEFDTAELLHVSGSTSSNYLGQEVRALEDWEGDGDDELLVHRASGLLVYEGGLTGTYTSASGYAAASSVCDDGFGSAGVGRFLAGATADAWACGDFPSSGVDRVLVYPAESSTYAAILYGESTYDYFGVALMSGWGRDANGDGLDDLWVGAYGDDDGGSMAGAVYIVEGGVVGSSYTVSSLDGKIQGGAANDYLGYALEAGDVDNDGYTDTVAVAYGADVGGSPNGVTYLFFDTLDPSEDDVDDADAVIYGSTDESVGRALSLGDVNGDGELDLLLCDPDNSDAGTYTQGAAWLFYGPVTASRDISAGDYDARWSGDGSYDYLGASCVMDGDLNGDGNDDIVLGGQGADHSSSSGIGAVFVMFGE